MNLSSCPLIIAVLLQMYNIIILSPKLNVLFTTIYSHSLAHCQGIKLAHAWYGGSLMVYLYVYNCPVKMSYYVIVMSA